MPPLNLRQVAGGSLSPLGKLPQRDALVFRNARIGLLPRMIARATSWGMRLLSFASRAASLSSSSPLRSSKASYSARAMVMVSRLVIGLPLCRTLNTTIVGASLRSMVKMTHDTIVTDPQAHVFTTGQRDHLIGHRRRIPSVLLHLIDDPLAITRNKPAHILYCVGPHSMMVS